MSTVVKDLGAVSAYAYAVEKGYTGTEEQFAELMASYADVGQAAVDAALAAKASEDAAKASETASAASETAAATSAGTATTAAQTATSAAATATTKATEAQQSATTATRKASEAAQSATAAAGSATTAGTAATNAQAAQTGAETAQGKAEDSADEIASSAAQIAQNTSDISELKEDLTSVKVGRFTLPSSGIIQGSYNATGAVTTNSARIRNNGFLQVFAGETLHFTPGTTVTQFVYGTFTSEKVFVSNSPWISAEDEIPVQNDGFIIVVFANSGKTDITPSQYDAIFEIISKWENADSELGKSILEVSADVEDITEIDSSTETTKTAQEVTKNRGYYWNGTANASASYFYVHLTNLVEGDKITVEVTGTLQPMRFIDAFLGVIRNANASYGSYASIYTVPPGVDNIYVTCEVRYETEDVFYVERTETTVTKNPKGFAEIKADIELLKPAKTFTVQGVAASLNANETLTVAKRIDNKKNCSYIAWMNFTTFDSVTLGHGFTAYGGSYVIVDSENITAYYYNGSSAVVMGTYAHGLTITDFVQVNIDVANANNLRAVVSVMTASGMFTQTNVPFGGCNGNIFVKPSMDVTNLKMQYVIDDLKCDVYLFGDSYTSLADPNRYPHQLMEQGYKDFLISGYSGASSNNEIVSFRNILAICKPKYLIWALGMNDADTSTTYNANWKTCLDEVIATCEEKKIELILATIPNVPNISNYYKNEYVRNSGYRYIDFAKAVGAESVGSSWYPGMLSSDNVHPAQLGAKALAARFLVDMPEIVT